MNRTCVALAIVAALCLSACRTSPSIESEEPEGAFHNYELTIQDTSGRPVEGAQMTLVSWEEGENHNDSKECTTGADGICRMTVEVFEISNTNFDLAYQSSVKYLARKDGYYDATGDVFSNYGTNRGIEDFSSPPLKKTVTFYQPLDYLTRDFAASADDRELRERALTFLEEIRTQSSMVNTKVSYHSVGTSLFKSKKYFLLKLGTTTSYNSLKLNKYDVAKTLFDDSVRKILTPLNNNISSPKLFYGYDIVMSGYTKDFLDEKAQNEEVEFRFLIPQETVRRYKDKDISGQQLLDASVILINDERVELKLQ